MYPAAAAFSLAALVPLAFSAHFDVQVGPEGKFVYDPPYITAHTGDTVSFIFNPKNHTVTQSAFDPPCVPLEGGFRSGFVPVIAGEAPITVPFTVPDNHMAPIWLYCGQGNHCGQGMVFAINAPPAPNERSFEAHQALAIARNGTGAAPPPEPSPSAPPSTDTWTPPPAQPWQSATATVTWQSSVWTTTYSSYLGSIDPTPAPGAPVEHTIIVGANNSLLYSPTNIAAKVGDTVTFKFESKNHTVTQSTFSKPCEPLLKDDGTTGFRSGFRPVAGASPESLSFSVRINDTAPIWGYCGQTGHCKSGMVFAINSVEEGPNNFAAFREISVRTDASLSTEGTTNAPNGNGGTTGGEPGDEDAGNAESQYAIAGTVALAGFAALLGSLTL